jgi:LacI family transcriptional regulator
VPERQSPNNSLELQECHATEVGGRVTKVTIQEVAEEAGVSKGTVSRVLNARDGVNEATRQTVLHVVKRMGYVPDPGARKLARRGRHLIGILPSIDDTLVSPYYRILLDAFQEHMLSEGYTARILDPIETRPPSDADGFVLLGMHVSDSRAGQLTRRNVPFVAIGRSSHQISWVDIDNAGGMREAVQHLIALGHRRIAHLTQASSGQAAQHRLEGYLEALRTAQLPEDRKLVWDGGFTEMGGYRAVRRAIEAGLEFTAIAAASDEMAFGAIAALEDAGLRVPWDVSVTGFDDLPAAVRTSPSLTTIRQPIREIGAVAAQLLLERMAGKPERHNLIQTRLVVRASSSTRIDSG